MVALTKRVAVLGGAIALGLLLFYVAQPKSPDIPLIDATSKQLASHYDTPAGICPWRDQDADMRTFFPTATSHNERLIPLSSDRLEIEKRIGRHPTGEELGFPLHLIEKEKALLGTIVAKRVRGDSGVIEILLVLDAKGTLKDWKIQRLREPEVAERFLRSESFHRLFIGQNGLDNSSVSLPKEVPTESRTSAKAVTETIRAVLILHSIAMRNYFKVHRA